jgi:hypothetical protein
MNEIPMGVDSMDTVKLIAEAAARAAASEVAKQVTEETKKSFSDLEDRIETRLAAYFGDKGANHHIIQHDRVDRLLDLLDKTSVGIVGTVIKYAIMMTIIIGTLGYLAWHKIQSLIGI